MEALKNNPVEVFKNAKVSINNGPILKTVSAQNYQESGSRNEIDSPYPKR